MAKKDINLLKNTRLAKEYVQQCCSDIGNLDAEKLIKLVFDAANSPPLEPHATAVEELGERMLSGRINGQLVEALIAINMVTYSAEEWLRGPARKILTEYYNREFCGKLKQVENSMLVELLETGQGLHSPEQLTVIMDHITKRAFTRGFEEDENARVGKVAVKLLNHPDDVVVFEAAFMLKELKVPSTYPHILNKLKEQPSGLNPETRRMLRAAAENIALEVTGGVFAMSGNYRRGDWNRQVFERMGKHNEMLRRLERKPREKISMQKK